MRENFKNQMGPEAMARDEPPNADFELLLPSTIKGFNLRKKTLFYLVTEGISDVGWNKEEFKKIIIERKVQDLVEDLVSNQLEAEKNTDLIEGKGQTLTCVSERYHRGSWRFDKYLDKLHGGPTEDQLAEEEGSRCQGLVRGHSWG